MFTTSGLHELSFSAGHAAAMLDEPDRARHDPFDGMLLAQARVEHATIVTSDRVMLRLGRSWIVDARR